MSRHGPPNLLDDGLQVDVGHDVPGDEDEGVGPNNPPLVDVAKGVSRAQAVVGGDDSHLQGAWRGILNLAGTNRQKKVAS